MEHVSRRSLLGAVAVSSTAAVAGCTGGILDDGGDESSTDEAVYAEWLAADLLVDLEAGTVIYADIQEITRSWPEEATSELQLDSVTTNLGVAEEDLDGMLVFETGGMSGMGVVLTGSFDQDALVTEIAGEMETESYGDYEVVNGMVAIGSNALVMSADYEVLIDAKNGDAERISDVEEEWGAVLSGVAGSGVSGVMFDSAENFELMGIAMDADGSDISLEARVHFADAETAESEKSEAETTAQEEFVESGEIRDISVEGNVVVVTAVMTDFQF